MKKVLITIAAIIGIATTIACASGTASDQQSVVQTTESPSAAPSYAMLKTSDIQLAPVIESKECFGSAGCNWTLQVSLTYTGAGVRPNSVWLVTYDVHGADDPQTQTLRLEFDDTGKHGQYERDELFAGTPSSSATLTLVVTRTESMP